MSATRRSLGLMINAGMLLAPSSRVIFDGPVIALGLTGESLSTFKQGPSVRFVIETGMFLRMPSLLISGGPFLSLLCMA